ncbi:ABC transporter ATP-binding protein [Rhodococcus sp. WS4]|nr:ABC transporter ATP-binding protein [Rhodococcus sp. WS4]
MASRATAKNVNGTVIDLKVEGLKVEYAGAQALSGIDLVVRGGQSVALLGSNGAGKSTVIRSISQVLGMYGGQVTGGQINFQGNDILRLADRHVVAAGVAQVPEGRKVFKDLSVSDNLLVAVPRSARHESRDRIDHVYTMFPSLKKRARTEAGWISGGEQQMLAIGRALMTGPSLLMIDELSLGLAPKVVYSIVERLEVLRAQTGIGILLVEQNARLALKFSDYAYVIENGRVAHSGESADLSEDREIERRYLGGSQTAMKGRETAS